MKQHVQPGDALVGRTLEAFWLARKFQLLVKRAERLGFVVAVDSDAVAIRIIDKDAANGDADLRLLGEKISVHNACGGSGPKSSGASCNYGNI